MWILLELLLFLVALTGGLGLTMIGLPGNWVVVGAAVVYRMAVGDVTRVGFSWYVVLGVVVLALLGEVVEFAAGAVGVAKVGGSRRSVALALVGSIVGGIAGLFVPIPIPLFGSLVGAVLCAGFGAFAGAVAGERSRGQDMDESIPVGKAAFWGRIFGTASKLTIGFLMVVVLLIALMV